MPEKFSYRYENIFHKHSFSWLRFKAIKRKFWGGLGNFCKKNWPHQNLKKKKASRWIKFHNKHEKITLIKFNKTAQVIHNLKLRAYDFFSSAIVSIILTQLNYTLRKKCFSQTLLLSRSFSYIKKMFFFVLEKRDFNSKRWNKREKKMKKNNTTSWKVFFSLFRVWIPSHAICVCSFFILKISSSYYNCVLMWVSKNYGSWHYFYSLSQASAQLFRVLLKIYVTKENENLREKIYCKFFLSPSLTNNPQMASLSMNAKIKKSEEEGEEK